MGLSGDFTGRTTSWPGVSTAAAASSPIVRPVTVIASACSTPASLQALRDQPRAARAVQIGGDEASAGLEIGKERHAGADAIEIVELSATPASRAIASRCSTALVDPPVAATDGDSVLERLARDDAATAGRRA